MSKPVVKKPEPVWHPVQPLLTSVQASIAILEAIKEPSVQPTLQVVIRLLREGAL